MAAPPPLARPEHDFPQRFSVAAGGETACGGDERAARAAGREDQEEQGACGRTGATELVLRVEGGERCCVPREAREGATDSEHVEGARVDGEHIWGGEGPDCGARGDRQCPDCEAADAKMHLFLDGALRASVPISTVVSSCSPPTSPLAGGAAPDVSHGSLGPTPGLGQPALSGMLDCRLTLPAKTLLGDSTQAGGLHLSELDAKRVGGSRCKDGAGHAHACGRQGRQG